MADFPLVLVTATIWTYWFTVGAMIVRQRRKHRKRVGLVPEQRVERLMWIVWVPLVVAWCALPYLALTHVAPPFGLPAFARDVPAYAILRGAAMLVAVGSLLGSVKGWKRMGKDWRMDTSAAKPGTLITDGLFGLVRHPIYALSMLLMISTAVIVPTAPMIAVAAIHVLLMNLKARNEERFLLNAHGDTYRSYLERTGRFIPRLRGPGR